MAALAGWLLSADLGRQKLSLLTLCVVAIYVVGSRLQWRVAQLEKGRWPGFRVGQSRLGHEAYQLVRLVYYVGIPVIALWRAGRLQELALPTSYAQNWDGNTVVRVFGVGTPGSVARLGVALAVSGGSLCLLTAVWVWYAHTALCYPARGPGGLLPPLPWWLAVREALFLQVFWSFCRSVVRMWTGDRVWVAFASVSLIAVMWVLNPLRLARLKDPFLAHVEVQEWMLDIWTGVAYLVTSLFWPLVLWHALWVWLGGRVLCHMSASQLRSAAGESSC